MEAIAYTVLTCASCTAVGFYLRFMVQSYRLIQEYDYGQEN